MSEDESPTQGPQSGWPVCVWVCVCVRGEVRSHSSTRHLSCLNMLFVSGVGPILGLRLHACHSHILIKCYISSTLRLDYRSGSRSHVWWINAGRKLIIWRPSLGNLLFMKSLLSNESVSNVDRWWNIHSLTADHIRVWLFVSFCFPTLICLHYTFPGSLTNTHQLQHRWSPSRSLN